MKIKIGSRGSKLAVAQASWVGEALRKANPDVEVEFHQIVTTGDRDQNSSLTSIGGKGVFVKEIEEALLEKKIDLAVHSLKDVPQQLPSGLTLGPFPKREDPRDVLVSRFGELLHELPKGSIIGTSSPRRQTQINHLFSSRRYKIEPIRGNVETRLKKVEEGKYAAVVMALAGLKRLGLESDVTEVLEFKTMLPAPCQGCLGLELREDNNELMTVLSTIKDGESDLTARAERAFLQAVGGDCLIPLAGLAQVKNKELVMQGYISDAESKSCVRVEEKGSKEEPEFVGARLGGRLLQEGGSQILLKL